MPTCERFEGADTSRRGLPPVFDGLGRIAAQVYYWCYQLRDLVRARFGV